MCLSLLTKYNSLVGSVALKQTFCEILDPKCMFWESKHKGKDFVKSKQKSCLKFMYKHNIVHIVAINENRGSPQISHKHTTTNSPSIPGPE